VPYEEPATPFVADVVGRPNLVEGTIEPDGRVKTVAGIIPVLSPDGHRPGDRVVVALRGEQLVLEPDVPDANGAAREIVRARAYRGDAFGHLVEVRGVELRARTAPSVSVRPGTPVAVRVVGCAVLWTAP
jgi:ABC-type Fe3+/spermidine/putrescine transport system ATPase subunit